MNLLRTARVPGPLATMIQPIVEWNGDQPTVFAMECLTRGPRGSQYEEAAPLFAYVRRRGIETEMDHACIASALRNAAAQCGECRIALNVHPSTLADRRDFVQHLVRETNRAGIPISRLIIEIGEQTPAADARAFATALARLRELGAQIAVDDVGYGHSNYKAILDCSPDFLKIDRYFIQGVCQDKGRRAVVRSIYELAGHYGAEVVAEGVERAEDHQALREMGIHLFQGFLYSRPISVGRSIRYRTGVGTSGDGLQHPVVDRVL